MRWHEVMLMLMPLLMHMQAAHVCGHASPAVQRTLHSTSKHALEYTHAQHILPLLLSPAVLLQQRDIIVAVASRRAAPIRKAQQSLVLIAVAASTASSAAD